MCWCCAKIGQWALNEIKEFSEKLTKMECGPSLFACRQTELSLILVILRDFASRAGQSDWGTLDSLWVTESEVTASFFSVLV